jgi:hypothetical protein
VDNINVVTDIVDITSWQKDDTYGGVHPFGSRDKGSVFSPVNPDYNFIKADHRYLFKESRDKFPWQFWIEVIAFNVGKLMNVVVPPAYVGYDSNTSTYAALIEWFYNERKQVHFHGGDIVINLIPDYDRHRGSQHNWLTIFNWEQIDKKQELIKHWAKIFIFDAFIGNTDRHQDNWGIIGSKVSETEYSIEEFSPAFDNGTSLGYEILERKFSKYDGDKLNEYIMGGKHHMKWSLDDNIRLNHIEMIQKFILEYPEARTIMYDCLNFDLNDVWEILRILSEIDIPVPLSKERINLIFRLFEKRYNELVLVVREDK